MTAALPQPGAGERDQVRAETAVWLANAAETAPTGLAGIMRRTSRRMTRARQPDPGTEVFGELAADAFAELIKPVRDSQVSATVRLTERDVTAGWLTLPPKILAEVAAGPLVVDMIRERVPGIGLAQIGVFAAGREGSTLTDVDWPSDVVAGTRVLVTAQRGGPTGVYRVRVDVPNLG